MYMFILIIYAYISENSILIFSTLSKSLSYVSIDSYVDTLLGIFILNSVHSPISLSTYIFPSCKFTSDLTNDSGFQTASDVSDTLHYKNGDKYVGEFKDGEQYGYGTFSSSNGAMYEGQWIANVRSGRGHYKWANGDEYEGEWKNDMPDGEGSLAMVDGTRYQGTFSKGKYDGKGIMVTPDGVRYEGSFKQGKKHGAFIVTDTEGKVIRQGVYKFGNLDISQK